MARATCNVGARNTEASAFNGNGDAKERKTPTQHNAWFDVDVEVDVEVDAEVEADVEVDAEVKVEVEVEVEVDVEVDWSGRCPGNLFPLTGNRMPKSM